jgi:hypothetical protein
MNALIRPQPLPDELDIGYLGRVLAINGLGEGRQAKFALRQFHALTDKPSDATPLAELLSDVAGLSAEHFVCAHTMLPLRRAITTFYANIEHGSLKRRSLLLWGDRALIRSESYLCEHCVARDMRKHGISYWRRSHQVPGQLWCPEHKLPLRFDADSRAFLNSPVGVLGASIELQAPMVSEAMNCSAVNRFLGIANWLMDLKKPLSVKYITYAILDAANKKGFRTNKELAACPLISDWIQQSFPHAWLNNVSTSVAKKAPGDLHQQLDDSLFQSGTNAPISIYLMAAAVLFESTELAKQGLQEASSDLRPNPRAPNFDQLGIGIKELRKAYVSENGHLAHIARRLNVSDQQTEKLLRSHGMPNLNKNVSKGKDHQTSADAFFNLGRSVSESAAIGGLTIREMESLIRSAGTNFAVTLSALLSGQRQNTSKKRAHRGSIDPARSESSSRKRKHPCDIENAMAAEPAVHAVSVVHAKRIARRTHTLETSIQN